MGELVNVQTTKAPPPGWQRVRRWHQGGDVVAMGSGCCLSLLFVTQAGESDPELWGLLTGPGIHLEFCIPPGGLDLALECGIFLLPRAIRQDRNGRPNAVLLETWAPPAVATEAQ